MEPHQNNAFTEAAESLKKVEGIKLLRLLRNPLDSLNLSEKEWIYGVIGLAASFVGYLMWVLLFGDKITDIIYSFIPFGLFAPRDLSFKIFSQMFMVGLLSMFTLLAALWLAGWWRSGAQPVLKLFIARIGGIQYICGAGFVLAGIFSFNFTLSLLMLAATLLSTIVLSVYGGHEASGISKERTASYMILSVVLYVVLLGVFMNLIF